MERRDFLKSCGLVIGGGDLALVRDFVEAVSWQDKDRLSSTIDVSIESHLMGFAAERSRRNGKKQKL